MSTVTQPSAHSHARVKTSVPVAFGVFVVYCILFIGLMKASGVDYAHIFDTASSTTRGAVIPLVAGSLWLVLFLLFARWDHVFTDPRRLPMGFWLWLAPVFMLVAALIRFGGVAWGSFTGAHIMAIVFAGVLVGFAEETLFRGIILRALRNGTRAEGAVVLWSSLWFGFFHLTNLITGSPVASVLNQCVLASVSGLALYLARRARGLLVFGMVLHGLWDMSAFAVGTHAIDGSAMPVIAWGLSMIANLAAIVALIIIWRRRESVGAAA
ncbi:MAG: CPBP family intramembrane glutamic endopeptidase [Actinomycetes bacterium]